MTTYSVSRFFRRPLALLRVKSLCVEIQVRGIGQDIDVEAIPREVRKEVLKERRGMPDLFPVGGILFDMVKRRPVNFDWLKVIQEDWEIGLRSSKRFMEKRDYARLAGYQAWDEQRFQQFGYELNAAHFLVETFCAVKFFGSHEWYTLEVDESKRELPSTNDPRYIIEAVDASGTELLHEGLLNMIELRGIRWLNISGCPYMDDYCLDRIAGQFHKTLQFLDISNCERITEKGITGLTKMRKLRFLRMHGLPRLKQQELLCLLLEEANPGLQIITDKEYLDPELVLQYLPKTKFLLDDDSFEKSTRENVKMLSQEYRDYLDNEEEVENSLALEEKQSTHVLLSGEKDDATEFISKPEPALLPEEPKDEKPVISRFTMKDKNAQALTKS